MAPPLTAALKQLEVLNMDRTQALLTLVATCYFAMVHLLWLHSLWLYLLWLSSLRTSQSRSGHRRRVRHTHVRPQQGPRGHAGARTRPHGRQRRQRRDASGRTGGAARAREGPAAALGRRFPPGLEHAQRVVRCRYLHFISGWRVPVSLFGFSRGAPGIQAPAPPPKV